MKKFHLSASTAMVAAIILTGCVSNKNDESKELQNFLVGSRAAEQIEKTNDKGIDAIADSSTVVYKRVGGAMREYIEKTRGDMATILLGRQIRNLDTKDEAGIQIAEKTLQGLTDIEKKDWTAERLYHAAKEKRALQHYMESRKESEAGTKLKNSTDPLVKAEIADGEKVFQATLGQENWSAKIAEMEKFMEDTGKIIENTAVFVSETGTKLSAALNSPALQGYLKETAALQTQKTFAGDARKKELDAEIEEIAAKAEYKPAVDEMTKLKTNLSVLQDGIGTQMNFTGKAIPWLIKEYTAASKL
jgi:hypothetical protein